MVKHKIAKDFSFCYGHRVWSQVLDTRLTEGNDTRCKCRFIHGHEAKVTIHLVSDTLEQGLVTDFKHLGFFKTFTDDVLDHKFIIDSSDPMFHKFVPEGRALEPILFDVRGTGSFPTGLYAPTLDMSDDPVTQELLAGTVVTRFIPTSENMSRWVLTFVDSVLTISDNRARVESVDWWETPKSVSTTSRA